MKKHTITTNNLILFLGALFVFSACVKKHDDKIDAGEGVEHYYAVPSLNSSNLNVTTDDGRKVNILEKGTYFIQDDYVGCSDAREEVGTLTADDKIVVSLSTGKNVACAKPSSLARLKSKPQVTFYRQPSESDLFIQTQGVVRSSGRTDAGELQVNGDVGIKLLDIVEYNTNSPLLNAVKDRIELRALPFERYKVLYKITPDVLYIMKVATKDKLSHLDLPISDNLGNGEYAVPIAAVKIETSRYYNVRNEDREKTNVYTFTKTDSLKETTHIKFALDGIKRVDLPTEISKDVYPADYFTQGQWYASESVIDTRPGSEGLIGTQTGAFDTDFQPASRVQFTRTSTGLVACNVGIDQRYAEDYECIESASVFTIPTSGHAFDLEKNSIEITELRIQSKEAPFIKVKFEEISSFWKSIDELVSLFRDTNEDKVLKLEFSENKFNLITQRGANGRRVIYSFVRADNRPAYAPKRHFKDDRLNKFGYFVQEKAKIKSSVTDDQEEDKEKRYLVQRHNPNQPIVFHFSTLTPKSGEKDYEGLDVDYRDIGRRAIEYWNIAFEKAGAPNKLVLNEQDVQYGDIEYNTLNLIDSEQGSNLLGVGPSLVDPYTGEVINANANVYIAPFREIIAEEIRKYIRAKLGYYEGPERNLPPKAVATSPLMGDFTSFVAGVKEVMNSLVPSEIIDVVAGLYHFNVESIGQKINIDNFKNLPNSQVVDMYTVGDFDTDNSMIQFLVKSSKKIPEVAALEKAGEVTFNPKSYRDVNNLKRALESARPTFYRSFFMTEQANGVGELNSLVRQIEENCSDINVLISKVKQATPEGMVPYLTTEQQLPALRSCMAKIIPDKFLATLIHEIGHTLGLRHNFRGSSDPENFYNIVEVKEIFGLDVSEKDLPKSSSVMDYVRTEQDRLYFPGHYDIAAIRYGYANKVEVESSASRPNSQNSLYVELSDEENNGEALSIEQKLAQVSKKAKPFAYCTDIEASLRIDPLCNRHDFGTTPEVIVEDNINAYWESFVIYNNRYDRISAGTNGPFARASRLDNLQRIYNEWRIRLANYLGKEDSTGNVYLQRYDLENYTNLIENLKADPNFNGQDYLAVRDRIFDFALEVAFFPNQYCLVSTEVGPKAYELSRLKSELKNQVPDNTKIANCSHPEIQKSISEKGFQYIAEAGLPVDNTWFAVNPGDTFQEDVNFTSFRAPLDVVGTFFDRYFASNLLGARASDFNTAILENIFPNMLDEPDLFEKFKNKLLERITQGPDLKTAFERANNVNIEAEELRTINFSAESALLKAMWLSLENGSRNQFVNNATRLSKLTRTITDDPQRAQEAQAAGGFVMPLTDGSFLVVEPDAEISMQLAEGLIGVVQKFRAAEQTAPNKDEVAAQLEQAKDGYITALTLEEGQTELSVEQYLNFARAVYLNEVPMVTQVSESLYLLSLAPYIISLNPQQQLPSLYEVENVIEQYKAQGQEPPAQMLQLQQGIISTMNQLGLEQVFQITQNLLQQQGFPDKLVMPNMENIQSIYSAEAKKNLDETHADLVKNIEFNRLYVQLNSDELEAQYDLLRSILIFDFSEVGESISLKFVEISTSDTYSELKNFGNRFERHIAEKYLSNKAVYTKFYDKDSLGSQIRQAFQ